jgi:hypothetical protein
VFRPPKDHQEAYQEAFAKGAKNSKQRTQYDTGGSSDGLLRHIMRHGAWTHHK